MIWPAMALIAVGLFLSAFFSGSETGFYRAVRIRLVLDALGGDQVARGLVRLTNLPMLFVVTMLLGNNLANYLTSLAIVICTEALIHTDGHAAELLAPLLLAPVLFVYGELLPKSLFLQAPNQLLRRAGPLLLVFVVLLLPISAVLCLLNKLLSWWLGESPEPVRLTLARRELHGVLEEGHEAGILHPAQRRLARGTFAVASSPVTQFAVPLTELPMARSEMSKPDVLELARQHRIAVVLVEGSGSNVEPIGYVRVIELELSNSEEVGPLRPLLEIPDNAIHLAALTQMQSTNESLAKVVDPHGRTVGIVTADRLRKPLL